jgi:hypothetical protein
MQIGQQHTIEEAQMTLRWRWNALGPICIATMLVGLAAATAVARSALPSPPRARKACELLTVLGVTAEADVEAVFGMPTALVVQDEADGEPTIVSANDAVMTSARPWIRGLVYRYEDATQHLFYFNDSDQLVAVSIFEGDGAAALPGCWQQSLYLDPAAYQRASERLN